MLGFDLGAAGGKECFYQLGPQLGCKSSRFSGFPQVSLVTCCFSFPQRLRLNPPSFQGWKCGWCAQMHLQFCSAGNPAHAGACGQMKTQSLRGPSLATLMVSRPYLSLANADHRASQASMGTGLHGRIRSLLRLGPDQHQPEGVSGRMIRPGVTTGSKRISSSPALTSMRYMAPL